MDRLQQQSVLALAYGWADAFGAWFGQVFRSAFVTNFLLAAFAVLAAALSLVWSDPGKYDATALADLAHHKVPFVVFELICILTVLVNTASGRWQGWHRRWFEGREVAERLRVALPLWVLVFGRRPLPAKSRPGPVGMRVRSQAQGMRAGTLDVSALNAARATLNAVLRHQCDYHKNSASRMGNMERRLEWVGLMLFVLTLITAGLFLAAIYAGVSVTPWVAYLVTASRRDFQRLPPQPMASASSEISKGLPGARNAPIWNSKKSSKPSAMTSLTLLCCVPGCALLQISCLAMFPAGVLRLKAAL